ncbi:MULTISPECIES: hypothetical protein [unclassified Anabaena]|uniref:hypothetical protein n=1 Tax=unclassified Anabaena TaxID=2619674 RepID=UPI000B284CE5|nr:MULTISPECIES: hypothetical protein [unclassified Anabaena]
MGIAWKLLKALVLRLAMPTLSFWRMVQDMTLKTGTAKSVASPMLLELPGF